MKMNHSLGIEMMDIEFFQFLLIIFNHHYINLLLMYLILKDFFLLYKMAALAMELSHQGAHVTFSIMFEYKG